jgi:hypothetical protein
VVQESNFLSEPVDRDTSVRWMLSVQRFSAPGQGFSGSFQRPTEVYPRTNRFSWVAGRPLAARMRTFHKPVDWFGQAPCLAGSRRASHMEIACPSFGVHAITMPSRTMLAPSSRPSARHSAIGRNGRAGRMRWRGRP